MPTVINPAAHRNALGANAGDLLNGQVAVRRTQGEADEMRQSLIAVSDIPETGTVSADLLGREVLVTMLNGKPRAFINVCMHHGGPLVLDGDRFTCEWHGSQFDARTGKALSGPVRLDARLIMLPTHVENGTLLYVYDDKANDARTVSPPTTSVTAADGSS